MDNYITISVEDFKEMLEARYKMNMIVNFLEADPYGPTKDELRCILGVTKRKEEK